jgi:hypothetical protein
MTPTSNAQFVRHQRPCFSFITLDFGNLWHFKNICNLCLARYYNISTTSGEILKFKAYFKYVEFSIENSLTVALNN